MALGVYSNNYIPKEKYAIKGNNTFSGNENDGHSSFLDEFVQDETNEKKLKTSLLTAEKRTEDNSIDYTVPSRATISDYIDNFLLINAEQVACTNMTQHLIKSDELKETLGFLNIQAAKTMFKNKNNKKNNTLLFKTNSITENNNFFTTGIDVKPNNFFLNRYYCKLLLIYFYNLLK